jgi:predicted DNA-binding protein
MSARITIRLDANLRKRLASMARKQGKRESDIVRAALEVHCPQTATEISCYDLAEKIGIIGLVKNAPSDLSTNRKHMEGFGQ